MKTRQGFVSNSSSSSFVLLGFIPDENEMISRDDATDDFIFTKGDHTVSFHYDDTIREGNWDGAIGIKIADDEELTATKNTFEQLDKWANEISEKYQIDKSRIKLYTGTRYC